MPELIINGPAGRLETLKEDLAQRKALDVVTESAKPISIEQAQARDRLWTPSESERANQRSGGEPEGRDRSSSSQLWTPGGRD